MAAGPHAFPIGKVTRENRSTAKSSQYAARKVTAHVPRITSARPDSILSQHRQAVAAAGSAEELVVSLRIVDRNIKTLKAQGAQIEGVYSWMPEPTVPTSIFGQD
jgi:predicted DNA-binding transcriptional regulator YafY